MPNVDRRWILRAGAALSLAPGATLAQPLKVASAQALVAAAAAQVGVTTIYDAAYVRLAFPGGDVPTERGVCTDVVVRAYRQAFGFDLQQALNADMRLAFAAYPRRWGLTAPDPHIDHRRVPNLQTYFTRQGAALPVSRANSVWQAGDLVTQMIPGGRPHIGIVANETSPNGQRPLLIHNIGRGTQIEDVLDLFPITGGYRFFPAAAPR